MILKMKMVSLIEKCIPKISQLNSQEIFLVSEKIISASSVFNLLIYLYIKNLILNNLTRSIKKKITGCHNFVEFYFPSNRVFQYFFLGSSQQETPLNYSLQKIKKFNFTLDCSLNLFLNEIE